jgi:hypothetical protein
MDTEGELRQALAKEIVANGEAAISDMIAEGREESLHLEFKTLASDAALTRDDRKMLAKAICGFANAEGGILVIGVETKKHDGVDVAVARRPIGDLKRFRRLIEAALPEMISPQHVAVRLLPVPSADGDAGFLAIDVPPSDNRPHMSVAEKRYFRRGSDGTRALDHGEIRELMLATREGALEIECNVRTGPSSGDLRYWLTLGLLLRNVGRVPVRAPYVRIPNGGWNMPSNSAGLSQRVSAEGNVGIYATRHVIVHLDDEVGLAERQTGLDFRLSGQSDLKLAVRSIVNNSQWDSFRMLPFTEMPPQAFKANDRPIAVAGFYGAENAPVKPFSFDIGKQKLLAMFIRKMSLD